MKKVLIGLISVLFAGICFAENYLDVEGNQHDRIWKEMRDNQHKLAVGGTLTNGLTVAQTLTTSNLVTVGTVTLTGSLSASGKVTSYSRATATGPSTTGYMIEQGTFSGQAQLAATTVTQAFTVAFTDKPYVSVINTNSSAYITNSAAPLVTVSNFLYTPYAGTGVVYNWLAIGTKSN